MAIQESLQKVIDAWKSLEWIPNSKSCIIDPSPINPDEFMITFRIEANIIVDHRSNPIRTKNRFFMFAQNDKNANPEGDVHNLKILLDHLDYKFQKAIDDIVSG